jgi:hypothetical protein
VTERYACIARLDGTERVFFWETGGNQPDRVVLHTNDVSGASLSEPPTVYDFDVIEAWCKSTDDTVDCPTLLNAWNLLGDLPGVGKLYASADARSDAIYEKLFAGCNVPSMTTPGNEYSPAWQSFEVAGLKRLLLLGLAELRARFR